MRYFGLAQLHANTSDDPVPLSFRWRGVGSYLFCWIHRRKFQKPGHMPEKLTLRVGFAFRYQVCMLCNTRGPYVASKYSACISFVLLMLAGKNAHAPRFLARLLIYGIHRDNCSLQLALYCSLVSSSDDFRVGVVCNIARYVWFSMRVVVSLSATTN